MGLTTSPPVQRTGRLGRLDACLFRLSWAMIAVVVIPLLQIVVLAVLRAMPPQALMIRGAIDT